MARQTHLGLLSTLVLFLLAATSHSSAAEIRSQWISQYIVDPRLSISSGMTDLVVCGGESPQVLTQTFFTNETAGFPGLIEMSSFDLGTGIQGARVKSNVSDPQSTMWFSNAQHPDRFSCNPADGATPVWLAGKNISRFAPDLNLAGSTSTRSTNEDHKVVAIASGSASTRFAITADSEKTDLGGDDLGFSTLSRYDGSTSGASVWSSNYQIPLVNPGNDSRVLNTKTLLFHPATGPIVLGHVYLGESADALPNPDIGRTIGGTTDLFALRYDAADGKLLARSQFGSGATDRILGAFVYPEGGNSRVGVISQRDENTSGFLMILDGLTLAVLNETEISIPGGLENLASSAAGPLGGYMVALSGYEQNMTTQVLSLDSDTLGKELASIPVSVANMTRFNTGIIRNGPVEGDSDTFYFVGSGGQGSEAASGDPHPYVGKLLVKASGVATATVVPTSASATASVTATGTASIVTPTSTSSRPSSAGRAVASIGTLIAALAIAVVFGF